MTMEKKLWEQNIPCDAVLIRRLQKPAGRIDVVLDTDTYNEIDDQFALSYMIRNEEKLNVKVTHLSELLADKIQPK